MPALAPNLPFATSIFGGLGCSSTVSIPSGLIVVESGLGYTYVMKTRHLLVALAAALLVVAVPSHVSAGSSEQITSFAVDANLRADSTLDVVETINYDFGSLYKHGIFRDIPLVYTDDLNHEFRPDITFISALQDGLSATLTQTRSNDQLSLKLGNVSRTITGVHKYQLRYSLHPIIQPGDGHDVFKLNVTGTGWTVPILAASVHVTLPAGVTALASNCFTGVAGSKDSNCSVLSAGQTIDARSSQTLLSGEGLSIFADLPTGAISGYLQPYTPPKPNSLVLLASLLAGLFVLAGLIQMIMTALAERSLRTSRTIVAQYEAPDTLRPAELGLLTDNKSGMPEITATLIDLAVRGHLRIEQTHKKDLFHAAAYTFHRLQNGDPLEAFEQKLIDALFGGKDKVELSNVDRTNMATAVYEIGIQVGDRMKNRGWYFKSPSNWRWGLPAILLGSGLLGSLVPIGIYVGSARLSTAILVFAGFLASIGLSVAAIYLLRRPSGMTPAGADEWAKVRGFKEYLTVAEKDRLKFSDAPDKTPERFNKLLPFAVALGVEQEWAKQFEGIDVAPATGWYTGYNPTAFSAIYLASSLGSDFSHGVASNFTPVSSSGSSSGGFSGGGFGGGGGGSW